MLATLDANLHGALHIFEEHPYRWGRTGVSKSNISHKKLAFNRFLTHCCSTAFFPVMRVESTSIQLIPRCNAYVHTTRLCHTTQWYQYNIIPSPSVASNISFSDVHVLNKPACTVKNISNVFNYLFFKVIPTRVLISSAVDQLFI